MFDMRVKDIVNATGGKLLCGDENTVVKDICIDSRLIKEGDLFVPIIGAKVDAHRFIEGVMDVGAATLTSQHNNIVVSDKPYIQVHDTEKALQDSKNGFVIPIMVNQRIRSYKLTDFAKENEQEIIKIMKNN